MKQLFLALALAVMSLTYAATANAEANVAFGELYYEGEIVRTVVPPAASPHAGRDNFYPVPNQPAVIGVAPGDRDYHGGQWAVHAVSWNVAPYLLTSETEVLAAMMDGDITLTRMETADFKCPVQP